MEIAKQTFERTSYSINNLKEDSTQQKDIIPQEELQIPSPKKEDRTDKEKVVSQIESMNKVLELNTTSLKFNLHEETERYYVQIRNQQTQEVIREIPTKEFLDLMAKITEFAGILIDKKI